jgi:acetyl esterase/lipase
MLVGTTARVLHLMIRITPRWFIALCRPVLFRSMRAMLSTHMFTLQWWPALNTFLFVDHFEPFMERTQVLAHATRAFERVAGLPAPPRFDGARPRFPTRFLSRAGRPPNACAQNAVLYVHGGGFVYHTPCEHGCAGNLMPILERDDGGGGGGGLGGWLFLSVSYTLERPGRRQVDQALACLRYLVEEVGVRRVVIIGDSAGGNIALRLLLRLFGAGDGSDGRDGGDSEGEAGGDTPADREKLRRLARAVVASVLLSPFLPGQHDVYEPVACTVDYITAPFLHHLRQLYFNCGCPPRERLLELARDAAVDLPPTMLIVGGDEVLVDTAASVGHALADAPTDRRKRHSLHVVPGEVHDFPILPKIAHADRDVGPRIWEAVATHIYGAVADLN